MHHLVLSLDSLNDTLEKFLYNQGVTVSSSDVRMCLFDIVTHLLTTHTRLALNPICDILDCYTNLCTEEKQFIASQLRSEFFFTLRNFTINKVTAFTYINDDLFIDGDISEL